jgi:hypothetical protein
MRLLVPNGWHNLNRRNDYLLRDASHTSLAAGDYFELTSGTAGGNAKTHVHLCNLHGELIATTVYALGNAAVCGVAFEGSKASGGVAAPVKQRVTQN